MKRQTIKIITLLILLTFAFAGVTTVFADADTDTTGYDITAFNNKGDNSGASNSITNIIGALVTMIRIVGTGVAVIMLIVLAIKYIAASPGDKAEIKKHAVVYVVGAVVLFSASQILGIIQKFSKNIQ